MKDKRFLDYSKAIRENEEHLLYRERHQTYGLLRDRMRFLRLLKNGECATQAAIGLKARAAEKLWKKYKAEGIEGLLAYPFTGRKEKISEALKHELQEELSKDQTQSLAQVQHFLEAKGEVHYTIPGIHYVLERMGVKKKTGRPQYYDKDWEGAQRFKKKSSRS